MKRAAALILILLLLLSAAGCTQRAATEETPAPETTETPAPETASPKPTETPEPAPTPTPEPTEEPEPLYRSPLGGAGMDEPYTARPYTVMFDNHPSALPHYGVSQADVLYEVLAEGGLTRMMGVFSDVESVEKLEPIRSIRPYFLDIAISYGAIICHAGGSDAAYSRIYNEGLNNIDGVRGSYSFRAFERDQQRLWNGVATEHTLMTTGENLVRVAAERNYATTVEKDYATGLNYVKDGTPENGETAETIKLDFGGRGNTLSYDAAGGVYTMFEHGADYIDGNTGEKVEFRNVIVFSAPIAVLDEYGRLAIDTTRGGEGIYACGGKYVPITWERTAGEHFRYYLADGSELQVGVGRTYIGILPTGSGSADVS